MSNRYRQIAPPEQRISLHAAHAEAARVAAETAARQARMAEAAEYWFEAMVLYDGVRQASQALACGRNSLRCDPNHFRARYKLGLVLTELGQLAEAEEHLEWCAQRKPGHLPIKNRLLEVKKRQLDRQGLLATPQALPSGGFLR
jgi:tetratricopeptide (TPR) repeat protein